MKTKEQLQRDLRDATDNAIAQGLQVCYDVCDNCGQMFDNVKHMRWFRVAVGKEIAASHKKYTPLLEALSV